MIIDRTQDFRVKFNQFIKQAQQLQQSDTKCTQPQINNTRTKQHQQHQIDLNNQQFKQIHYIIQLSSPLTLQYQLSLKYAKSVHFSLHQIQQILHDKKQNYFSNAAYSLSSFTNQQRNQFDEQTKTALKMCSDQIDQLNTEAEKLSEVNRHSKKNSKIMETYVRHMKEVILCLHHYFKRLQREFGEFLKYNQLKRQKILNTLAIQPQTIHKHQPNYFQNRHPNTIQQSTNNINSQLQKQAQLFYIQKIEDQKKALQTKQTIQSINSMLQEMGKKVLDQQLLTSSFQEIGSVGLGFIDQGNRNLLEANTMAKSAGKYWMFLFLGLAASLLFVDFLKS